ncbi:T4SS efffector SepA family protein [Pleomorphomonas carboxyditropha]|uniref:Uncharacterized protein n=1 Tax=Pleomorphomonas carboxyditropha TaxID=2023338 RepID=A0A2G9WUB0_9HYPH|nr:hypothetical protein [Pleomorphomonas carboxyditropha]PIO98295.1 hypothetical protein CJ014_16645 [Pleomorphomonas carboxyditropha]
MMPVLRVSDATFADLVTLKTWYGTKTPGETIDHIVREAMEQLGIERDAVSNEVTLQPEHEAIKFDSAPGLTFTKPIAASVNGKSLSRATWSSLLLETIAQVKSAGVEGEKLVRELSIPAKVSQYEEEGYRYHPSLGISVQGQSAADAWKQVELLAKKWRIPVSVQFIWRQNPKAQYPGKTGSLRVDAG